MTPITSLLLVTSLISAVFAAPTQPKRRSFRVDRVRQANYVPNGHAALRKAYVKFGLEDITFLPNADAAAEIDAETAGSSGTESEVGEVSASPTQNDAEFLSPVSVGGQTIVMDFDTGSSDMWVFNTQLSSQSQTGHTIFDPTKSSTFQSLEGATFNISYGDGSFAEGPVGLDTVNIGGATVTQQAIGLPTSVADSFVSDASSNGLVGLAFSKLNTVKPQQQKTFFDNVMDDLEQPVFTANLKHGVSGAYEFGTIDDTQFTGSLTQVPVDASQGFWEFETTQIAVGSGQAQSIQGGTGTAIADTGTSLLIVDDAVVTAYYSQVDGAQNSDSSGGVIFPCTSTLPSLSLAVGDSYMAVIDGSLLNFSDAGKDQQTGEDREFLHTPSAPRALTLCSQSASVLCSPMQVLAYKFLETSSLSRNSLRLTPQVRLWESHLTPEVRKSILFEHSDGVSGLSRVDYHDPYSVPASSIPHPRQKAISSPMPMQLSLPRVVVIEDAPAY